MDIVDEYTARLGQARAELQRQQAEQNKTLEAALQRYATDGAASLLGFHAAAIAAEKSFEAALHDRREQFLGVLTGAVSQRREDPDAEAKDRVDEAEEEGMKEIAILLAPTTPPGA